jgi:hypothetical protein
MNQRQSITDDLYVDPMYDDPPPEVFEIRRDVWGYRDFVIYYDPPPIPSRGADYQAQHEDNEQANFCGPTLDSITDQIEEFYENE